MAAPPPDVSVVVLASGRDVLLNRQLHALEEQTLERRRYEVVVADERRGGEVRARNAGWRRTRADRVVFTSDAGRAVPGWLEALLETSLEAPKAIVHGPTVPFADKLRFRGPLFEWLERPSPDVWFPACNVLYPRHVLEQLNGFDEVFGGGPAADADLAARAIAAGARPAWVAHAAMPHDVVRAPIRKLRRAAGAGELALLLRRHPTLRGGLARGVFWRPEHEWLVRAGAAALMPERLRWLRWWLAAPYVARLVGARTLRVTWPFQLLCDLVEAGALARGAVRYGVLVL